MLVTLESSITSKVPHYALFVQRLSHSGYVTLAKGLPHCPTLRRLSFAGSHMGDAALEALKVNVVLAQ